MQRVWESDEKLLDLVRTAVDTFADDYEQESVGKVLEDFGIDPVQVLKISRNELLVHVHTLRDGVKGDEWLKVRIEDEKWRIRMEWWTFAVMMIVAFIAGGITYLILARALA